MKRKEFENKLVYSTNPDINLNESETEEIETLPPSKQDLRIRLDKKQRKGKQVTLVTGFVGSESDLSELGKQLKTKCGVGGTVKENEIIIQGDFRQKIKNILDIMGFKSKISG